MYRYPLPAPSRRAAPTITPGLTLRVAPGIAASALVGIALLGGCSSLRPTAQRGIDLLENGQRSPVSRTFAGGGALVGLAVAMPFTIILSPAYWFEDEGDGEIVREPDAREGTSVRGDVRISLCLVPLEFGRGLGAAVLGSPAAWIEEAAYGEPARPVEWIEEVPDELSVGPAVAAPPTAGPTASPPGVASVTPRRHGPTSS